MGEFINPADVPKVKFYTGDEAPLVPTDLQQIRLLKQ